ncbi:MULTISPECIES: hypothetical protein [unclassified Bradyrhizobium]
MSFASRMKEAKARLEAAEGYDDPWCTQLEPELKNVESISTHAIMDLLRVNATTARGRRLAAVMRTLGYVPIRSRRLMPGGFRDTCTRGWAKPLRSSSAH